MASAVVKCKIVGGKVILDFEIFASSTIDDLKENIYGMTKLEVDRQILTCCSTEMKLENSRSIESYGFTEEALIRLDASPLPDDSGFNVLVKHANDPYAKISMTERDTVADLKVEINKLWHFPTNKMTLMLNRLNISMEDDSYLSDYYISEGTCIRVVQTVKKMRLTDA